MAHAPRTSRSAEGGAAKVRPWSGLHSSRIRYRFKVDVFDFMLQWLLGAQTNGGSEVGEAFYAASIIRDGDPATWVRAFTELGERVARRGDESLARGHRVSARESYLRAYSYTRAPLAFLSPLKHPEEFRSRYERARRYFRLAADLADHPIEAIEIPFEDAALPAYFATPADDGRPRRTLIMAGGGDTFVEDLWAYIGPAAIKRDWNLLIVDFPAQGILPFDGLTQRVRYEEPMAVVVDHLLEREQVDPERIAAFGISGGGFLVPRAVSYEKRIRACVALSMMLDVHAVWVETMGIEMLVTAERRGLLPLAERYGPRRIRTALALFDTYKWRYGVDRLEDFLDVVEDAKVDPELIDCPTLVLVAEQEYEEFGLSRRWQDQALEQVDNPNKQLIVLPRDEGADSHSGGTNLSLVAQLVFDWLDETFAGEPARVTSGEVIGATT